MKKVYHAMLMRGGFLIGDVNNYAMAMGLTQEALTWRFLFVIPIPVTR